MPISLRQINDSDLELIMNWRMSPSVTKYMNTDPVLTIEGQRKWFASLKDNTDVRYWLVEVNGEPAGVINLTGLNNPEGDIAYAYYIGEKKLRSFELAVSLEMSMYDYVFDVLKKKSVWADVFIRNAGVIRLHELCGAEIMEIKKDHIEKNGTLYDVAFLCTTAEKWYSIRESMTYEKIDFGAAYE